MKPIIVVLDKIPAPKWAAAITLWPFIFIKRGYEKDKCLLVHEMYHINQITSWGVIPWYICYGILSLFYIGKPSNEHPLEKEAYKAQKECKEKEGN